MEHLKGDSPVAEHERVVMLIHIFHPDQLLTPGGGVTGNQTPECRLHVLIDLLRVAARLGMKPIGQAG
jgi:hypothetical protein